MFSQYLPSPLSSTTVSIASLVLYVFNYLRVVLFFFVHKLMVFMDIINYSILLLHSKYTFIF